MKKLFAALILLSSFTSIFCQKQNTVDSIVNHFNLLNDQSFADLSLEDTSGNLIHTASLRGKTIYVDFWFTTCPPCIKEIPFSKALQQDFAADTNIVFLSICIENIERKTAWKQMIRNNEMPGVQLFYARNRPQKINLLRKYYITFPTYLLVNKEMKITGYDAPRPSEKAWVNWAIVQACHGKYLSESYKDAITHSAGYDAFIKNLKVTTNP